jgi:uncharacterized MAPEG superfamily protein
MIMTFCPEHTGQPHGLILKKQCLAGRHARLALKSQRATPKADRDMTQDLWALLATILLAVVQLTLASILSLRQLGGIYIAGPRDTLREATGMTGRIVRAHRNLLEIFPQFAAALFIVHASGKVGTLSATGAWLFFAARCLYVPAYAFGPTGARPLCWLAAQAGIFIILADIVV